MTERNSSKKNPQLNFFATFFFIVCHSRCVEKDFIPFTRMWFYVAHFCSFPFSRFRLWPHHKFIGAYYAVALLDRFPFNSNFESGPCHDHRSNIFLCCVVKKIQMDLWCMVVNGKMILCKAILHIHQKHIEWAFCCLRLERRRVYLYCLLRGSSHPAPGINYTLNVSLG